MLKTPEYSLILPFHSNERLLQHCIKTLLATVPSEVEKILVLNNSHLDELSFQINAPSFRLVKYDRNLGYSKAINTGVELAKGKTLIFSDADTFYLGNWFQHLTHFYKNTPNIGLASSKLLDPRNGRILDFGIAFTRYNAPHPQRDLRHNSPLTKRSRKVQAACSASMIIDRALFSQIGMFDESLHNSYCDLDLCLRLNEINRDCWVVSKSVVFHRGSSAQTNRNTYVADVKALFAAKNEYRIVQDMEIYFHETLTAFSKAHKLASKYLLVDLSSVVDRDWHHDILRQYVDIASTYECPFEKRDAASISLIDHLGVNILEHKIAIIYFVDRFIALENNEMWLSMRSRKDDLIVDRNANVTLFTEVVNGAH